MTVRVRCPNPECGTIANVEEGSLGRRGRCQKCGHVFALARPDGEPASAMSGDASAWKGSSPGRPAASPIDLPEQFGRYRIMKQLGQGGMGAVYLAHDTRLNRSVALKVPYFSPSDGPQAVQRFEREAHAAATLDHPNLCPIFDVGEVDGIHYLTMPYIEGKPLSEAMTRGQVVTEPQATAVARKLALALHEAHEKGIIHRDLKPGNIMVNRRRELIIMDFGLARMAGGDEGALTRTGNVLGTALYMAPEQAAGNIAAIGPACDVYSLGVILYELLTGVRPFEGPWSLVIGLKNVKDPDPPVDHRPALSPALNAVCLKAIARDPKDRYATMAEFAEALRTFLAIPAPTAPASDVFLPARSPESLAAQVFAGIITDEVASLPEEKSPAQPKPARSEGTPRPPGRGRIIAAAGAAAVLLLGVIICVVTDKGQVRIEVSDPDAVVTIEGKDEPKTSRADETEEVAKSGDNNSKTKKTDDLRGDNTPLVGDVESDPNDDDPPIARPTTQTPLDSAPKLVVFYDFDDGKATDRSGHGHHGTFSKKPPTFTTEGYQAGALVLDASQPNFLRIPVNINPSEMPRITMGGWFNARSANTHGPLISHDNGSHDRALTIDDRPRPGGYRWSAFTGKDVFPGVPVVLSKWVFVVMRHDQATKRLTLDVDGETFPTTAYFGPGANATFIGKNPRWKPTFDGKIDNVFIFNYFLNDRQVEDIRNRGKAAILSTGPPQLARNSLEPEVRPIVPAIDVEKAPGTLDAAGSVPAESRAKVPDPLAKQDPEIPPVAKEEVIKKKAVGKAAVRQDGWVSLFNGRDLTGWKKHPKQPGIWHVDNGVLVGSGPTISHLYTERDDFTDFHLRIEARFNKGGRSGLFFRCPFGPRLPADDPKWPDGYGALINRISTGGLYPGAGDAVFITNFGKATPVPFDQWFMLDVIAEGNILASLVNGQTSGYKIAPKNELYPRGHIALQQYTPETAIEFRKIEIKELNRPGEKDPKEIGRFPGHKGRANHVAFSPDGLGIVSDGNPVEYSRRIGGGVYFGGGHFSLRLFEASTGRDLSIMEGQGISAVALALSSDGRHVASSESLVSQHPILIWDLNTGKRTQNLLRKDPIENRCVNISFSPDDRRIMAALTNGTVLVWDLATEQEQPPIALNAGPIKQNEFRCAAFGSDRKRLVTGSRIGAVEVWELEGGKKLHTFAGHVGEVLGVACSADGRLILSCGADNTLRLWDVATGRFKLLRGEERQVLCIAFSPDGRRALSAGVDGPVRLWDLASGKEVCRMDGHTMPVNSVAFSPDGRRAVSGSDDRTVRLWQLPE